MRKFDTKVQLIKYKVLKEVAIQAWNHQLFENLLNIPKLINPTKKPISRCCVYKEHAILSERVKLAIGGDFNNKNIIEVIDIACDECPVGGYEVSNGCRGCLANKCQTVCPRQAITLDSNNHAVINKEKCIECGLCAKACPYDAIRNIKRPCIKACQVNAIKIDENKIAVIDNDQCIQCGACVNQCPFGAMMDKSFIINVIDLIQRKDASTTLYAMVAPSIASQFQDVSIEKVFGGLKTLGFDLIIEAALGADMVAKSETKELIDKSFLTSSCCPSFVQLIKKHYPDSQKHISHNPSPMAYLAQKIKEKDPKSKLVFIGPCIAKKSEALNDDVKDYIDAVITFEELEALFDSRDIQLSECSEIELTDASYYGRIFARSGGLVEAIKHVLIKDYDENYILNPTICNGIDDCKKALFKLSKNLPVGNFIEGMICEGGCIGGPSSISHHPRDKKKVEDFGEKSTVQ